MGPDRTITWSGPRPRSAVWRCLIYTVHWVAPFHLSWVLTQNVPHGVHVRDITLGFSNDFIDHYIPCPQPTILEKSNRLRYGFGPENWTFSFFTKYLHPTRVHSKNVMFYQMYKYLIHHQLLLWKFLSLFRLFGQWQLRFKIDLNKTTIFE